MKDFCTQQRILNITNSTNIYLVEGSVLSDRIAEGVAIFIPPGFVHLQIDGKDFFRKITGREMTGSSDADVVFPTDMSILKCIICIDLPHISDLMGMYQQLTDVLNHFSYHGTKSIAMNGIDCGRNRWQRPEKYQLDFIKEYILTHDTPFEEIFLVDLHGGFNKYC